MVRVFFITNKMNFEEIATVIEKITRTRHDLKHEA